jgi:hypothetical protein
MGINYSCDDIDAVMKESIKYNNVSYYDFVYGKVDIERRKITPYVNGCLNGKYLDYLYSLAEDEHKIFNSLLLDEFKTDVINYVLAVEYIKQRNIHTNEYEFDNNNDEVGDVNFANNDNGNVKKRKITLL